MTVSAVHDRSGLKAQGKISLRFSALRYLALLTCCAALILAASPARAQADMRTRVNQLENQVDTLSRAVFKGEMPMTGDGGDAPANGWGQAQAQLQDRISQLENSLTTLTGRMEDQQHALQTLQQRMEETLARLDQRLQALEQHKASPDAPVADATPHTALTGPSELSGDDKAMPPQPQASSSGGANAADGFNGGTAKSVIDPNAAATQQTTKPTSLGTLTQSSIGGVKPAADSPEALYEAAYTQLKNEQYGTAEVQLKDFIAKYPKHQLAANAQYWLGESYYARAQYSQAAKAFASAYQKYPDSPKGPDALLKMGLSLNGMGDKTSACLTYGQLKKQFPLATQAIAKAQEESKKLGCK